MLALFKNRVAYLGTSFVLFMIALPLVSFATTGGPRILLWIGLAAMCVGGLIPPVQRILFPPNPPSAAKADDKRAN